MSGKCLVVLLLAAAIAQADQQFADIGDLQLVGGGAIEHCRVGYRTDGTLNADKSNVIVMPTWFGGTAEELERFGIIGPGKLADTDKYYVIAIDALANSVSCSPSNSHAVGGGPVPAIAIEDMVNSQYRLLTEQLGFRHVKAVMGISMGGMQTYQWIASYPDFMDKAVPIQGTPRQTSFDLIQWQTHKNLIRALQAHGASEHEIGALITDVNLLTLFTPDYFVKTLPPEKVPEYMAQMRAGRVSFHADDYVAQLEAMIGQDVTGTGETGAKAYADRVKADVLIVGVTSDHMVNPGPGEALAPKIGAESLVVEDICGHVGSDCQAAEEQIGDRVAAFLAD